MKQLRIAEAALQGPEFVAAQRRIAEQKLKRRYGCERCTRQQDLGKKRCSYCSVIFTDMEVELVK